MCPEKAFKARTSRRLHVILYGDEFSSRCFNNGDRGVRRRFQRYSSHGPSQQALFLPR